MGLRISIGIYDQLLLMQLLDNSPVIYSAYCSLLFNSCTILGTYLLISFFDHLFSGPCPTLRYL